MNSVWKQLWDYATLLINMIPSSIYEGLLAVFCVGTVLIFAIYEFRNGWRKVAGLLLIEYLFLIFCSTVFFRDVSADYNFTPFWSYLAILDGRKELIPENIMNVVVFVPIGMLMGVMADVRGMMDEGRWKKGWQVALIIGTGLGISISIETMQYFFHRGFAELDDVMHNTIGGMIGYGIYQLAHRFHGAHR